MQKLLEIQLKKSFGQEWKSKIDSDEMGKFLTLVDQSYLQHNGDYQLLERILEVSSNELTNANKEILKNHELLHSVTESINDSIFYKNLDFKYIGCNHHFEELAGKSNEEIIGKDDFELFDREYANLFRSMDELMLEGMKPRSNEEWVKFPDGRDVLYLTTKAPLLNTQGKLFGLVGISRDITKEYHLKQEIKSQQEMLIQQSRLAALGEMIGNIAHQWRQPLNTLGLIVQDVEDAYSFGEVNDHYIKNMSSKAMEQINYMSRTIDDFRNFFSPHKTKKLFLLKQSILESIEIVGQEMTKYNIKLTIFIPEELTIYGSKNEFSQVLFNLIKNAKDALVLNHIQEPYIRIAAQRDEDKIEITVQDNGGGIPEAILANIFDPYFTTREEGSGTGIGLYMSKMIIQEHMNGTLNARNSEDGAIFTIVMSETAQSEGDAVLAV